VGGKRTNKREDKEKRRKKVEGNKKRKGKKKNKKNKKEKVVAAGVVYCNIDHPIHILHLHPVTSKGCGPRFPFPLCSSLIMMMLSLYSLSLLHPSRLLSLLSSFSSIQPPAGWTIIPLSIFDICYAMPCHAMSRQCHTIPRLALPCFVIEHMVHFTGESTLYRKIKNQRRCCSFLLVCG
jgi:hypothetical protein